MFPTYARRFGWHPFSEMRRFQDELNRTFSGVEARTRAAAFPPVNLWAGDDSIAVTAELPGVSPDDLDLSIQEDTLVLSGERKAPETVDGASWHRRERAFGKFSRAVELSFRVDPDKVEARFRDGVLEVELHRPEADLPRRIKIKAK